MEGKEDSFGTAEESEGGASRHRGREKRPRQASHNPSTQPLGTGALAATFWVTQAPRLIIITASPIAANAKRQADSTEDRTRALGQSRIRNLSANLPLQFSPMCGSRLACFSLGVQ